MQSVPGTGATSGGRSLHQHLPPVPVPGPHEKTVWQTGHCVVRAALARLPVMG